MVEKARTRISSRRRRRVRFPSLLVWSGCVWLHVLGGTALAQKSVTMAKGEGSGSLPWLIAGGIAVIVCVTGFLNPKRTHQD